MDPVKLKATVITVGTAPLRVRIRNSRRWRRRSVRW
jgi:hypothetical protein